MNRAARPRTRLVAAVLLGVLAVLAGACDSNGQDWTFTPGPAASTSPDTPDTPDTAPPVTHPLNASRVLAAPCSALTRTDLARLDLAGASWEWHVTADAPVCNWNSPDATHGLGIAWIVPNTTGLSSLYAQRPDMQYWQPTTIAGYPAVFADIADLRARG